MTRKTFVGVRLSGDGLTYVDEKGKTVGLNRSETIRVMLRYAAEKMPDAYLRREAGRTGQARIEWTHPRQGLISEVVCGTHHDKVLRALHTLGIGCIGSPVQGACWRCEAEGRGVEPRWELERVVVSDADRR